MEVINKLYHTVSNTVSQISYALPGNAVTKEYEVFQQIASAGPGHLWKIYNGCKKTTKQEASIFVFEKKNLEKFPKDDREIMLDILKRSVIQLTKIRHPKILTVQHPLEESRDCIAFATEPVFASLGNVLGESSNIPSNVSQELAKHKLFDVEIKYGLLQLIEGMIFLHSDAKLLHKNICPESIVINKSGSWKIFGFDYCVQNQGMAGEEPNWPFTPYNSTYHILTQPSLEYMAPESVLHLKHSPQSDLYALAILIYSLHSVNNKPMKFFGKSFEQCKKFALELQSGRFPNLSCIPNGLVDYVRLMLNSNPENRPSIYDLSKISYFDDIAVKTLNYLDSSFQWTNLQKSKFFKGLPQILKELPHRIQMQHILPSLTKEFINPQMVPFVLPNFFFIAEQCTKDEYRQMHISIKPVLKMQEPIQILLILIQNIELLLKQTPTEDLQTDVLPMLYRALETNTQQIQDMCLYILPQYAANVDYSTIKNGILPRIRNLCLNSQNIKIIVNCLTCIGKLLEHMDKWLVLDDIVPFLMKIKSSEPPVIMGIIDVLKLILASSKLGVTKDVIAGKVIPFLMPLSIENNLSLKEFDRIMELIKELVNQVEIEHRSKLEQLQSIQQMSNRLPTGVDDSFENIFIPKPTNITSTPSAATTAATINKSINGNAKVLSPISSPPPPPSQSSIITPAITTKTSQQKDLTSTLPKSINNMSINSHSMNNINNNNTKTTINVNSSKPNYNLNNWNNMSSPQLPSSSFNTNQMALTNNTTTSIPWQSNNPNFGTINMNMMSQTTENKNLLLTKSQQNFQNTGNNFVSSQNNQSSSSLLLQPIGGSQQQNRNSTKLTGSSSSSAILSQQDILDFLS